MRWFVMLAGDGTYKALKLGGQKLVRVNLGHFDIESYQRYSENMK